MNGESDELRRVPGEALGQSEVFLEFQERLSRVAAVDRPVLLIGERGTGKELAAARIHYLSRRWQASLVPLNAATLPATLIESELFGYEPGAFTGASRRRIGRFEQAGEGTLFLDEIALIPIEVQEKILRVVEYGAFERVGGTRPVNVDVRIVGAANVNLAALAGEGKFKHDLLDRLSFEVLFLPPLRRRMGDVMLLANHFAVHMAHELGWNDVPSFSPEIVARLEAHPWPGNIRELKNVVERAVYRSDSPAICEVEFEPFRSPFGEPLGAAAPAPVPAPENEDGLLSPEPLREAVVRLETGLLRSALVRTQFNQRQAARLLDLSYHQFRWLYRKYESVLNSGGAGSSD